MIGSRRFFMVATALVVPSLAVAQGKLQIPDKWYGVRVEGNAFTVEMPGIPDHKILNDVSARGTAFALHSYSLEAGGNSFVAQTALFPADVEYREPRRVLQSALDNRAKQLNGGKWTRTDWREIGGAAAVESTGTLTSGSGLRQLVVVKEKRFVSLAFMGPNTGGPDANRFFKSLKLN
ncbi:MAG: hypothetical protein J0J01_02700 [Reyranella sp.]|uniref:hypothetical protein n=1 Tax=Reyranella sp. TaxID=1929291 RepID=UPI001ACE3955|nr:hypothetical protein [Reyranella sp.]MBN9085794.1 hypothetical protein [Reyranella sp.]